VEQSARVTLRSPTLGNTSGQPLHGRQADVLGVEVPVAERCEASRIEPEHAFSGALTLIIDAYGQESLRVSTFLKCGDEINKGARTKAHRWVETTNRARGVLSNLRREVEAGLLISLQRRVESDVLSDLV
jgi:hypothetical protein